MEMIKKAAVKKTWCQSLSVTRQETRSNPFQSTSDLQVAREEWTKKKSLHRKHSQGYTGRQI